MTKCFVRRASTALSPLVLLIVAAAPAYARDTAAPTAATTADQSANRRGEGLELRRQRCAGRSEHRLRRAAQRDEICAAAKQHAQGQRRPAHALRRRQLCRGRRPARARAFPRTYGVQRLDQRARGRDDQAARAQGAGVRRRHQCLDRVRRDDLQARPAQCLRRSDRHRADADARDGERTDDRSRGGRTANAGSSCPNAARATPSSCATSSTSSISRCRG